MGLTEFVETMCVNPDVVNILAQAGITEVSSIREILITNYPNCKTMTEEQIVEYFKVLYEQYTPTQLEQAYIEQESEKKVNPISVISLGLAIIALFTATTWLLLLQIPVAIFCCNNTRYNNWLAPIVLFLSIVGAICLFASEINVAPTLFKDTVDQILNIKE